MITKTTRSLNLSLRLATAGIRFLFLLFLAKYLEPSLVGYYGIFVATVGYSLFFVGLDFYVYVSREITKVPASHRGKLLKSQATFVCLLYMVALPIGMIILSLTSWPGYLVWWFAPILMLEHFNQEISRLFIALSEQLTSSIILFFRQGSWTFVIILLMILDHRFHGLEVVMLSWAVAGVISVAIAIWKLKQLRILGWDLPVDWSWVKRGAATGSAFLLATLALRGVQILDRYWLEILGDIETVGAYVLFFGIASSLVLFLEAAIFSFAYPVLIEHNHKGEIQQISKKVTMLFNQTLFFSALFILVSWTLLPHLLAWINNPIYQKAAYLYPYILLAMILNVISMAPHYGLYACGKDKSIICSHLAALFTFCFSTWTLSTIYGAIAIPLSLSAAFAMVLIWKSLAYMTLMRRNL